MTEFQLSAIIAQLSQRAFPLENLSIEIERVRQAAVTVLLRENQRGPEILMIKRADYPNDPWSGHLALPGGRADAEDEHLLATAAREMWEEVGIRLNPENNFIGRLTMFTPQNPNLPVIEITPFVAVAPDEFSMQFSAEVAAAFWLPVRELEQNGQADFYRLRYQETIIKYPAYPSPQGPIWGITARILNEFLALLK